MRYLIIGLVVSAGLAGCTTHDAPLPPVPPPLEDLSSWSIPELVQPEVSPPAPAAVVATKPTAAEKVYVFTQGGTYTAPVASGAPLDIVLEQGEHVRNIVGGDRAPVEQNQPQPWEVKPGAEGEGETERGHIFVTVSAPGLMIGMAVTTTKRTYLLTLKSVPASPIRVLRWTYPASTGTALPKTKKPRILPDPMEPKQWHAGYRVEANGRPPDWTPRQVLDDGKKLYILYPEVSLFGVVPLVRMIGTNGPQLLNTRQVLNVVIVDQLAARLELRVGTGEQAETVSITRETLKTITCPGDSDCPQFPQAAQTLAGGMP